MLFLWLLLLSGITANAEMYSINGFDVNIEKNILYSVEATANASDSLDLSDCGISDIKENAFQNLAIKHLSLANNDLKYLPVFVFRPLRNLVELSLANNRLRLLQYYFGGINNLRLLDIRHNGITVLHPGSLYGLTNKTEILHQGNFVGKPTRMHFENPFTLLSLCIVDGVVKALEVFNETKDRQDPDECAIKIRPLTGKTVDLSGEGIEGFEKGWYQLHEIMILSLDLSWNMIGSITSEMLNDLPTGITKVNFAKNGIRHLKNGIINNYNLRKLDFTSNPIRRVDEDALAKTENLEIILYHNELPTEILITNLMRHINIMIPGSQKPVRYIVNADPSAG